MLNNKKEIRIISWGGIGDALLLTPAFSAIKAQYPEAKLRVYYPCNPHKQIFENNPHIDSLKRFSRTKAPLAKFRYYIDRSKFSIPAYGALYPSKFYQVHAMKIIAEMLDIKMAAPQIEIYLTADECKIGKERMSAYKNPIMMQVLAGCSDNKNWPASNWEKLVAAMPEYTFIQVGAKGEEAVKGAVNMNGLSFRESFAMLKYATSFIGVESCFAHASNAFNIPGVVLFGASTPVIWGHKNNINLYKKLSCSPCLDILFGDPCPYGKTCMDFGVEEVRDALLQQIVKEEKKLLVYEE